MNARERRQLESALDCNASELSAKLRKVTEAAREEYQSMMLGQKVFSRGQDIREYRLFLLIKHLFDGKLPTERAISNLFQATASQSRSLLRAVLSKYRYELDEGLFETLKDIVRRANRAGPDGEWLFATDSEAQIEALNRSIEGINPQLTQVGRRARTVGTYEIANATYEALRTKYGL